MSSSNSWDQLLVFDFPAIFLESFKIPSRGRRDMSFLSVLSCLIKISYPKDFPSGPGVETPCFQCREHRLDPWSGN